MPRLGLIANEIDKDPDAAIPLYQEAIALVAHAGKRNIKSI